MPGARGADTSYFSEILGIRLETLASLLLQVTRVAANEPHRQGEDGPRCPRRRGVLVRHFLLLPRLACATDVLMFVSLRMDFQDFCHYFTDVVVCRLVERFLLWPRSHWREEHLHGEWAPAPSPGAPPPGNGMETRPEERGGSRKRDSATEEERRWQAEVDKRSRCGGCINHRDTFLHNPQVKHPKHHSGS